jgi:hypothetical protein
VESRPYRESIHLGGPGMQPDQSKKPSTSRAGTGGVQRQAYSYPAEDSKLLKRVEKTSRSRPSASLQAVS